MASLSSRFGRTLLNGSFILTGAFSHLIANASTYCDDLTTSMCYYYGSSYQTVCYSGSKVAACPTANLLGFCTIDNSKNIPPTTIKDLNIVYYYARNGMTSDNIGPYALSCTGPAATWTSGSGGPTATTPLPAPPTSQSSYTASNGTLPAAAVQVAASGTYGSASLKVTFNISQALTLRSSSRAATTYNLYVVAMVPGALVGSSTPVIYVKPQAPATWKALEWPMAAFMTNVAQSAVNDQVIIEILEGANILALTGTEIYVGYGTSDQEMLAANRFRGVYKVQ